MKKCIYFLVIISLFASMFSMPVSAENNTAEFYVSVNGSDDNDGTKDKPFATIEKAQEEVRKINKNMNGDITVYIREGAYALNDTLRFNQADSGSNGYYVRYKAYENEKVKISGGSKVVGWSEYKDGIYKAPYGDGSYVRQLSVNGNRARRAQTENMEIITDLYDDTSDDKYTVDGLVFDSERFADYKNKQDIQVHFSRGWYSVLLNTDDIRKSEDGKSIFFPSQPDLQSIVKGNHPLKKELAAVIENAFEELDTPGEFYYDRVDKMLYYMPRSGEDMSDADVWAARLETVLEVKGESGINKVTNIEFSGIEFAHGTWYRPAELGLKNGQAQVFNINPKDKVTDVPKGFVPSCIQLQWAEKINFTNDTVKDMGAVGIGLYQGVNYCSFEGNTFADIADSAMTVGLPNQTYHDEVYEGFNLAADKPTTSSGETTAYPSSNVVDVNKKSIWSQSGNVSPGWVQIDLLKPYRIDRIEIVGRQDMNQPATRANFEIQASNDPDFEKFVVLASRGSEPFEDKSTCVLYSDNEEEYRYVRVKKSDKQYFVLAEVRLINEDMPYSPNREACKFNRIRNNYITRTSFVNWGAPAIQGYYTQNLDITHNEIYNVPYSGICIGWGWTTYPDSTVCRDNKVMYNRVHRNNLINFDGGSFYSLGQMPNTVVKGNYMSDQPNYIAGLYSDNGSKYQLVTENVVENVNQAYFLNAGTGYLTYKKNYSPHSGGVISNTGTAAEPTIRYIPDNPPTEVLEIMNNAGIEKSWISIKERAGEDMWPISTEHTYADAYYDQLENLSFRNVYFTNFINSADNWLKLAEVGTDIGTYSQEGYNAFREYVDEMIKYTKDTASNIKREEIIDLRLEYEEKLEAFKASKNTFPTNELIAIAENEINSTPVGVQIGNTSQKNCDRLKELIEAAKVNDSHIAKLMLERGIRDFRENKINLDISEFKVDDQLEDAVIDKDNKTVTVKVKYTADMSKVKPASLVINDEVNIAPSVNDAVNMENGTEYTISAKDGSQSCKWRINIVRPEVIESEEPYIIKNAVEDDKNWYDANTMQKYYKGELYGDITLKFKAKMDEYIANDWPSFVFRNQSFEETFSSKTTSAYVIVLSDGKLEFHRFNNGVRTQFYGEVDGVEQLCGPKLSSDAFVFGRENDVEITCKNTDDGVRIIFKVNGKEVFNVLDNYPGAITTPGYFGTISPKIPMKLSVN